MGQESAGSEKGQARSFISSPPKNSCRWLLLKYLLAFKYMMPTLWLKSNKIDQHKKRAKIDIDPGRTREEWCQYHLFWLIWFISVDDEPDPAEKESFFRTTKVGKAENRDEKISLSSLWKTYCTCKKWMMHEIRDQDGYTATRKFHILCRSEARRG